MRRVLSGVVFAVVGALFAAFSVTSALGDPSGGTGFPQWSVTTPGAGAHISHLAPSVGLQGDAPIGGLAYVAGIESKQNGTWVQVASVGGTSTWVGGGNSAGQWSATVTSQGGFPQGAARAYVEPNSDARVNGPEFTFD